MEPMDIQIDGQEEEAMDIDQPFTPYSEDEINYLVRRDLWPNDLENSYSGQFHDVIRTNWDNLAVNLTISAELFARQFQFRFAVERPYPATKEYWPATLSDHPGLMKFTWGVLHHFFQKRRNCVYLNFSPAILVESELKTYHFLYSSRSNFCCLPTSYLVHDEESYNHFIHNVFGRFDLEGYMKGRISELNRKYDGIFMPVSLTVHVTNCINKIYGWEDSLPHGAKVPITVTHSIGLSSKACCDTKSDCLWNALSSTCDFKNGKLVKRSLQRKGKVNRRIANRLKKQFMAWFKKVHGKHSYIEPICQSGFNALSFGHLESFLGQNIMVYHLRWMAGMKVARSHLKQTETLNKVFISEYKSEQNYDDSVILLTDGKRHIRSVIDANKLCKKIVCQTCQMSFYRQARFEKHTCRTEGIFRHDCIFDIRKTLSQEIAGHEMASNLSFDDKYVFVNIRDDKGTVIVKTTFNQHGSVEETFPNMSVAARYIVEFLPSRLHAILSARLISNLTFMSEFEKTLNKQAVLAGGRTFKADVEVLKYFSLKNIKTQVLKYLSSVTCIIFSDNFCHAESMMNFLTARLVYFAGKGENVKLTYCKGKLATLHAKGFPASFKNLSCMTTAFSSLESGLEGGDPYKLFESVRSNLLKDFKIDLLRCKSMNALGQCIMSRTLLDRARLSFLSPSRELHAPLKEFVRYGMLVGQPCYVHKDSTQLKAGISLDFKKFYLSIAGNTELLVGQSLEFQQGADGKFSSFPTRKRGTFANILFCAIDEIIADGQLQFSAYGREQRFMLPVDAVLTQTNGQKTLFSYEGCLWHLNCDGNNSSVRECHLSLEKISPKHRHSCLTCKNAEIKSDFDVMKPHLWKLKSHENMDSSHPVKKSLKFHQVAAQSFKNRQTVLNSGDHKLIVISECQIIEHYYSSLKDFMNSLGLKLRSVEFENVRLCDHLIYTAQKHFPLMNGKHGESEIRQGLKAGKISGFSLVDADVGSIGRKKLGLMKPFCYKQEGKNVASYSITRRIVENSYLQFLLNCNQLPDFRISRIHSIFEFKKPCEFILKPFESEVKTALSYRNGETCYTQVLKNAVNSSIGNFSLDTAKYNRSLIGSRQDFYSMTRLKHLVASQPIDSEWAIFHFKNMCPRINLNHVNAQIISVGKRKMIDFALRLTQYTSFEVIQMNCDGLSLASKQKWSKHCLETKTEMHDTSCLDQMLRPHLFPNEKWDYVKFKKEFFPKLNFCNAHENSYLDCLQKGVKFSQLPCCVNSTNSNVGYLAMKIEFLFDAALFLSSNRYKLSNSVLEQTVLKCSGHYDKRFDVDLMSVDLNDLMQIND